MKKKHFICRCISVVCILAALFAYQTIAAEREAIVAEREAQIKAVEEYNKEIQQKMDAVANVRGRYTKDGRFEGSGNGYGGDIRIEATITNGYLEDIRILSHEKEDAAYFTMAEKIVYDMVDAQSADVDVVSGATFSSKGIIAAVTEALEKAE